jgi:hypothetical protein
MESIGDADELSPDEPEGTGPGGPGSAQQIWTAVCPRRR